MSVTFELRGLKTGSAHLENVADANFTRENFTTYNFVRFSRVLKLFGEVSVLVIGWCLLLPFATAHRFCAFRMVQETSILGDPGAVSRGRAKWRDESFQERAEEPLGTKSHRTISKRLREYRLLIGQKKSLV